MTCTASEQRVVERQQRGGRADLQDDRRPELRAAAWRHRQCHEQQAGQRGRRTGDRDEEIAVTPNHHRATLSADPVPGPGLRSVPPATRLFDRADLGAGGARLDP
jgi:hypothetical protein